MRPFWKGLAFSRLLVFTCGAVALGMLSLATIRILSLAAFLGFMWGRGHYSQTFLGFSHTPRETPKYLTGQCGRVETTNGDQTRVPPCGQTNKR